MKISRAIRLFIGFAFVTLLDVGMWWVLGPLRISVLGLDYKSSSVIVGLFLWLVLLIGVVGMICSLVAWSVAGAIAGRRAKASPQKDLSHV